GRVRLPARRHPRRLRASERLRHALYGLGRRGRRYRGPPPPRGVALRLGGPQKHGPPPLAREPKAPRAPERRTSGGDTVERPHRGDRGPARAALSRGIVGASAVILRR